MRPFVLYRSFLSLVTAVSLTFVIGAHSKENDPKPPAPALTTEEIRRKNLDSLFALAIELNGAVEAAAKLITRNTNESLDLSPISELARIHIRESLSMLYGVLRSEFKKAETQVPVGMSEELVTALINAIGEIGTLKPDDNLLELEDLIEEARGRLKGPVAETVVKQLYAAMDEIKKRPFSLVNLDSLIQERKIAQMSGVHRLEQFERTLDRRIIGQADVKRGLLDIEWRAELKGRESRTKPDAIYMMGLPGTGKDTTAEAWTDAIHGYEGAYHDHLYELPEITSRADAQAEIGSPTGYIGSEDLPPFLAFLVLHSGGRYKLESKKDGQGRTTFYVIENPEYKGEILEGYYPPESGVVYVNEFHNWSRRQKDRFLKKFLEDGLFHITNPNGGLSKIFVPIRLAFASNEGIRLLAAREANGVRRGPPRTFEQIHAKWQGIKDNKKSLKNEILANNAPINNQADTEDARGMSEELLNRIPDSNIFLMEPQSPENLQQIGEIHLKKLARELGSQSRLLGDVTLSWTDNVKVFLQEYDFDPEVGSRAVIERIKTMIEDPLVDAAKAGTLKPSVGGTDLSLDVKTNPDKTRSLVIGVQPRGGTAYTLEQVIRHTEKDRPKSVITDETIERLSQLGDRLKSVVFGIDPILDRLAERVVAIENEAAAGTKRPANIIMLNGPTSTGKTETAKQLSRELTNSDEELVVFSFNDIQTLDHFQEQILGMKDKRGNPIPSRFMKAYDDNNGRLVVALDELANVRDMDLLTALYDFFREPEVTFSDGVRRPMGGVILLIPTNAGQLEYLQVPRDLPMEIRMKAWAEVYRRISTSPELQRRILEKYFPAPLLARIGRNNIFFIPPHNYKSLRQLAKLKLSQALERIANTEGKRGWEVVFPDEDEYKKFVSTIVEEGFNLDDQGASIEKFVQDDFEEPLKAILLKAKVPSGGRTVIRFRTKTDNTNEEKPGFLIYDVYVENQLKPLEFKIRRPFVPRNPERNPERQILTSYHESGHSIVQQSLFGQYIEPMLISVLPGMTIINDQWVYYLGIAQGENIKEMVNTRDWIVGQIAVLAGGEAAERLVSRGNVHTAGKRNDIERATHLARSAVLRLGLSDRWGVHAIPSGMSEEDYIAGLSDKQRELLETETQALVKEGRKLAERILEANFNSALVPLALQLAEVGLMDKDDLKQFYSQHSLVNPESRSLATVAMDRVRTWTRKWRNPAPRPNILELDHDLPKPRKVADPDEIARAEREEQYKEVPMPSKVPVGTNSSHTCSLNLRVPH